MSDKSGAENIYAKPLAGTEKALTSFKDGRVLWPSISADGRTIVFERGFRVWKLDVAGAQTGEVAIALRGAPSSTSVEHLSLNNGFQSLSLSPDGKKLVFISHKYGMGGQELHVKSLVDKQDSVLAADDHRFHPRALNARRDSGKFTTALKRDFNQATKAASRATRSGASGTSRRSTTRKSTAKRSSRKSS